MSGRASAGWIGALSAITAGAIALLAASKPAHACSCRPKPLPAEALADADAVFEGRAYGQTVVGMTTQYTFEVDRVWKGELSPQIEITTPTQSSACGRVFELSRSYIVYARRSGTQWSDNMCSRTLPAVAAAEDRMVLGEGALPFAPDPLQGHEADQDAPPLEPPRVDPTPAPTPASPSARGCAASGHVPTPDSPSVTVLALLLLVPARRR